MSHASRLVLAAATLVPCAAAQVPSSDLEVRRDDQLWFVRAELGQDYAGELIAAPTADGHDVLVGRPRHRDDEGRLLGRIERLDGETGATIGGWFGPPTERPRGDGYGQEFAWLEGGPAPRLTVTRTRAEPAGAPRGALGELLILDTSRPDAPVARLAPVAERMFFGTQIVAIDDVDGDGLDDIVAASLPRRSDPDGDTQGRVELISSASGERLASWGCPEGVFGFGEALASGDVDGDGRADVIVGSQQGEPGETGTTEVWVHAFDVDGDPIRSWRGTSVVDVRLLFLGDVDGDDAGDLAIVGPRLDDGPEDVPTLSVVSGGDGAVLYSTFRTNRRAGYGTALARLGDVDGDGADDFAISEPRVARMWDGRGRIYLVSGADGEPLGQLNPGRLDAAFGLDLAAGQFVPGGPPELVVRASAIDLDDGELDEIRVYDLATVLDATR